MQPQTGVAGVKDDTAALWLNNKLGSSSHLWSFSSHVVSQYTVERLQAIRDSFAPLDPLVKFKFFLTLFHIPKRNLEEFKPIIQEIIDDTIQTCMDQWVLSLAVFIKPYWSNQYLNTLQDYELESFQEAYNELLKGFRRCVESESGCEKVKYMLPVECDYMNKSIRYSVLPMSDENQCLFSEFLVQNSMPQAVSNTTQEETGFTLGSLTKTEKNLVKKHFTLVKNPKSASFLDDLKAKSVHYAKSKSRSLMSTSGSSIGSGSHEAESPSVIGSAGPGGSVSSKFPFINRYSSKKMESIAALNNSPDTKLSSSFGRSSSGSGSSSFFKHSMINNMGSSTTITGKASTIKRDIGIKLLDASEQSATPQEAKRKRKEQEKEALKKQKMEQKQIEKEQQKAAVVAAANATIQTSEQKRLDTDDHVYSNPHHQQNAVDPSYSHNTSMTESYNNGQNNTSQAPMYNQTSSNGSGMFSSMDQPPPSIYTPQISTYQDLFSTGNNASSSSSQALYNSNNQPPMSTPQPLSTFSIAPNNSNGAVPQYSYSAASSSTTPTTVNTSQIYQPPALPQTYSGNQMNYGAQQTAPNNAFNAQPPTLNQLQSQPLNRNIIEHRIQPQAPLQQTMVQQPAQQTTQQQPSLTLTREQMLQAQEMFSNSNRLTRPEKALILAFIAGSRDNPRPDQGPLLSIKLNEVEEILTAPNGQQHRVLSELYFQMNYDTGEYKKVKKLKPITSTEAF